MARFRPKISLHGSGEVVELSNGSHADFTLMQGASGLGMRPREITTVALPSGGSLVQHRKGLEADVQIPVLLGGSERQRWDLRRKLERLVRDEVEIRVTRPNGVHRSRFGFYKAGLEGEYGAGEDSPNGEKRVLEFTCPEGMWKGEEQSPEFRLAGLRKRFLSERAEPVPTGRENLALNPSADPDGIPWGWAGGSGVRAEMSNRTRDGLNVQRATVQAGTAHLYFTTVDNYGNTSHLTPVDPGDNISVRMLVASSHSQRLALRIGFRTAAGSFASWSAIGEYVDVPADGELTELVLENQAVPEGAAYAYFHTTNATNGVGSWVEGTGAKIEVGESLTGYFDGDSSLTEDHAYGWSGKRGESTSIEYVKESTYQSPFFPMILASSSVQGEIEVSIGGDAPAYPTWVVDGPGTDLIIENDKGDSLKVLTEFEDQVTITTDQLRQDITSPSMPDGELWEYVPTTSKFFALEPGMNKLKVSMVGAKPNSRVQCLYRENFWAGW